MVRPAVRRFTVDDYHRMAEAGILMEDDPVELISGEILEKSPITPRHVWCTIRLNHLLIPQLGDGLLASPRNPIRLSDDSEPEPDFAVIRDRPYEELPTAADVLLVIEVADTSQEYDRSVKLPLYAAAGIPELWLIDLAAATVERHTDPGKGYYRLTVLALRGESLSSAVLPDLTIAVDDVLGQAPRHPGHRRANA